MNSKKKDLVLNIRMRREFGLHTCTNESFHIFFVERGRKPPEKISTVNVYEKARMIKESLECVAEGNMCWLVVIT